MTEESKAVNGNNGATRPRTSGDRYRVAFFLTLTALIVVVAVGVWIFWRSPFNPLIRFSQQQASAPNKSSQTAAQQSETADNFSSVPTETPLAAIQLSPQRMQSIGVKIGTVESKNVNDEIRFYGNVQANERRFAYVQTRFAGWIREVFADATGDFVRMGQPLFTIYSPDLVASER